MTSVEIEHYFGSSPWLIPLLAVVGLWSVAWSIVGMWTAARNGHKVWFVVFFFVHTLGILEIIYLSAQRRTK